MFLHVFYVFYEPCNSENQMSIIAVLMDNTFFWILNPENWLKVLQVHYLQYDYKFLKQYSLLFFSPLGGSRARFKHHIDISSFLCDISRGEYVSKFIYFLFNLLIYIFSNTGAGYTHQSDIGQKHRNIQSFTLTFTPNRDLEWGAGLAFI